MLRVRRVHFDDDFVAGDFCDVFLPFSEIAIRLINADHFLFGVIRRLRTQKVLPNNLLKFLVAYCRQFYLVNFILLEPCHQQKLLSEGLSQLFLVRFSAFCGLQNFLASFVGLTHVDEHTFGEPTFVGCLPVLDVALVTHP